MREHASRLLRRALLAALGAAVAIVGFEAAFRSQDRVAAARQKETAPRSAAAPQTRTQDPGCTAWLALLCADATAAPEAEALWQILADGRVLVRRPPPLPRGPGRPALAAAAIVLPGRALLELAPEARAALLDLLSKLLSERPVASSRVRLLGVFGSDRDLAGLLDWLR